MCRVEKKAVKSGFTASTARWICELAGELGVDERRFYKAVAKLAKSGIWLEEEDWRIAAKAVDLRKYLEMVVDYILRRVSSGASVEEAVRELPKAVEKAGKLAHIREVLSNFV